MSPALCPILPKHIYGDGQDLKTHPRNGTDVVGSGPFRVTEFKPAQRIVLERFDKFFLAGKPYLDKVIINVTPDMASLMLGLERGDIQMIPFATVPSDLKRLATNPQLTLTSKGYDGIGPLNWLAFNLAKKPLSDVQVRKAIAHAIDKNFIAKNQDGVTVNRWLTTGFLAASATTNETAFLTYKVVRSTGILAFDNQARV